jgi:hypothetical protein
VDLFFIVFFQSYWKYTFLVIGFFTLFLPFAVFRSIFLILPHVCIAYANTTTNNTFNGHKIIYLTFKISKKFFGFLTVSHMMVCNLVFSIFLLNHFIWKLNLSEVASSYFLFYPWFLSLFILLYWLLTSVYAKHLISNFELEKGDNRTKF